MITLKDFMETVSYRITEGSDYYDGNGKNYSFTYWNGRHEDNGCGISIVFNTDTQEVLIAEACDYKRNRAYRLLSAESRKVVDNEEAWDFVKWTDLETDEDWLEKAQAIVAGEDYDDRVSVPLELSDEEMLKYMTMAHERDMTFNAFVEEALRAAIEDYKRDPEGMVLRAKAWTEK